LGANRGAAGAGSTEAVGEGANDDGTDGDTDGDTEVSERSTGAEGESLGFTGVVGT
jgi:hypothetical protein